MAPRQDDGKSGVLVDTESDGDGAAALRSSTGACRPRAPIMRVERSGVAVKRCNYYFVSAK